MKYKSKHYQGRSERQVVGNYEMSFVSLLGMIVIGIVVAIVENI